MKKSLFLKILSEDILFWTFLDKKKCPNRKNLRTLFFIFFQKIIIKKHAKNINIFVLRNKLKNEARRTLLIILF